MGTIHREGKGGPAGCSHLLTVTELLKGGAWASGHNPLLSLTWPSTHTATLSLHLPAQMSAPLWEGGAGTVPGTGQA